MKIIALLDAAIDLILERYRDLLKRGAVLVDPDDDGTQPRALVYLEHAVQDGRLDRDGNRQVISWKLTFVEIDGTAHEPRYLRKPFRNEPDFEVTSVTYDLRELLARAEEPG